MTMTEHEREKLKRKVIELSADSAAARILMANEGFREALLAFFREEAAT